MTEPTEPTELPERAILDTSVVIADGVFNAQLSEDAGPEEFTLTYTLLAVVRDDLIQELGVHQDVAAATQAAPMPETS